jgi:uncharacterized protein YndB with AHSA1/START domain
MSTDSKPKTRDITLEVEVAVTPAEAWKALTDPAQIERWFPLKASGKAGPGESVTFSWGPGMEWTTRVKEWNPPAHVRWEDPPDPSRPGVVSAIDFHVETRGGRTVVRLVHSGFDASADWDDQYTSTENGWRYFLMNLRHYLERHANTPRTMVWDRRKMTKPPAEVWNAIFEQPILGGVVDAALDEVSRERHAWGRIPSLNDALVFVELEGGPSAKEGHIGVWISTYGVPAARTSALQNALTAALDRRLGHAASAAG